MDGTAAPAGFDALRTIRLLRAAGPSLLTQAGFYGELIMVEWAVERRRLLTLLIATLVGMVFLHCVLLAIGALLVAATWGTPWCAPTAVAVLAGYALGLGLAWHRFNETIARSSSAFVATREELAADLAVLRSTT